MTSYKYQKQHASKYNYKSKRSFGQRIKNFFTIPEEDLKEEPSKEFEKIKLFTLNRGWLFLSILLFMIIINVLVAFNINFLYLRQILGFLFLILIPGLLIMLCFKIRTVKFWEYLVYTVGLSIAFIMFAGLAVNWALPALNITDKPLSLWPILICFDIFLLGLWLIAIYRNRDIKPFDITIPKLDTINRIFFIIPMIFPLLSILGAFLLNNHGPNILTMIMLGGIAIYVLLLVIFRKRMNENVWPWAILMMSLAILLSGWMRSWFVSGVDINLEYSLFNLTQQNEVWMLQNMSNNYDAMLSLTILPTILNLFIKTNISIIIKLILPILFSLSPIVIYLITKKYFNNIICFLSGFFFISQEAFINWMSIPIRQEIAFLFFGLIFLILFTKDVNKGIKKIFFTIFGLSMIVSHYSTAYVSLAIITLTYVFILIYKIYEKQKIKKGKINSSQKIEFYLTGTLVLLLLIFGFLWYNQVTSTSEGLISFMDRSISNLENIFNEEVQSIGQSPLDQFKLFNKQKNYYSEFNKYVEEYPKEFISKYPYTNFYDSSKYTDYNAKIKLSEDLEHRTNDKIILVSSYSKELLKFLIGKILIVVGVVLLYFNIKGRKEYLEYLIITFFFLMFLFLMIIIPFITLDYELMRAYQQILILLSTPAILGIFFLFGFIKRKCKILCISFLVVIYFLFLSNFISQLTGGNEVPMTLNNFGGNYNMYFSHNEEVKSGYWLSITNNFPKSINIDNRASYKLYLSNMQAGLSNNVLPSIISRNNYVYSSYTNTHKQITFKSINGIILPFNFPDDFLNDNKNKVYTNGGSEIFR